MVRSDHAVRGTAPPCRRLVRLGIWFHRAQARVGLSRRTCRRFVLALCISVIKDRRYGCVSSHSARVSMSSRNSPSSSPPSAPGAPHRRSRRVAAAPVPRSDTPPGLTREGWDRCELLLSPNPGSEPRPLQRIASGGERKMSISTKPDMSIVSLETAGSSLLANPCRGSRTVVSIAVSGFSTAPLRIPSSTSQLSTRVSDQAAGNSWKASSTASGAAGSDLERSCREFRNLCCADE